MLADHKGSLTVTAMVGTGLVTLGVALTSMVGLSDDLQAASRDARPTTPLLTPGDEAHEMLRLQQHLLRQRVDCTDRAKAREQVTGTPSPRGL